MTEPGQFVQAIQAIGGATEELDDLLARLVREVRSRPLDGKGTLTLRLTLRKGAEQGVCIEYEAAVKSPPPERSTITLVSDRAGRLALPDEFPEIAEARMTDAEQRKAARL